MNDAATPLVCANDLRVQYAPVSPPVLNGVSLTIQQGESVAIVGDSGCGKSTLATAMMHLLPRDAAVGGAVLLYRNDGTHPRDVLRMNGRELRNMRGRRVAMVFQNAQASLNPVVRVGLQIAEVVRLGQQRSRSAARREALELLGRVGLADPARMSRSWAHELSGGMAQRVMLAIALAGGPDLLIADEPTSGLDANVQVEIVELLRDIQRETNMALLLITHDMGIAQALADRVCVMDGGTIVDDRSVSALSTAKLHEATVRLLEAADRKRRSGVALKGGVQ